MEMTGGEWLWIFGFYATMWVAVIAGSVGVFCSGLNKAAGRTILPPILSVLVVAVGLPLAEFTTPRGAVVLWFWGPLLTLMLAGVALHAWGSLVSVDERNGTNPKRMRPTTGLLIGAGAVVVGMAPAALSEIDREAAAPPPREAEAIELEDALRAAGVTTLPAPADDFFPAPPPTVETSGLTLGDHPLLSIQIPGAQPPGVIESASAPIAQIGGGEAIGVKSSRSWEGVGAADIPGVVDQLLEAGVQIHTVECTTSDGIWITGRHQLNGWWHDIEVSTLFDIAIMVEVSGELGGTNSIGQLPEFSITSPAVEGQDTPPTQAVPSDRDPPTNIQEGFIESMRGAPDPDGCPAAVVAAVNG